MSRKTPTNPNEIAVITVHGTGDTADGPDGGKWFQRGSAFAGQLTQHLAAKGITAEIVPHLWSGANSARGREDGARDLSRMIRKAAKKHGAVHVIGHSHGGNVANDAAAMLGWRLRKKSPQKIAGVTTVGTPFFKSHVGAVGALGGIVFLAIMALSVAVLLLAALVALIMVLFGGGPDQAQIAQDIAAMQAAVGESVSTVEAQRRAAEEAAQQRQTMRVVMNTLPVLLIASGLAMFVILPVGVQGALRVLRVRRRQNADAQMFSIYHPNDEAIAFLQRVEELPIEPFPRWSLWRGSRMSGIMWGVRWVLILVALAVLALIGHFIAQAANVTDPDTLYRAVGGFLGLNLVEIFGGLSLLELAIFLFVFTVLGAPLIWGLAYGATRAIGGLGAEFTARGWLNGSIANILRGMAFGQDGDEKIGRVSMHSHTYGTQPYVLEGALADRMRAGAATAATALIEKYRWALFTVGPDTNGAVSKLATDAMTWDSLIHTTYFDQPETAQVIGDYIAECVVKQRETWS